MTKTLAIILNHNLPEYTNLLYQSLKEFQDENYDLLVMDNGSKPELMPAVMHIRLEKNLYWGGALNEAFKLVLNDPQYDSLLFLNNDMEVTAEVFVNLLRGELFSNDLAIVSPCIAGRAQPWKQMQSWGSHETRIVKWVDLMAPLFHRKFIEAVGQYDPELYYGWGQELLSHEVCTDRGWRIGVCDHISILHVGKQTLLQNRLFSSNNTDGELKEEAITLTDSHARAMDEYRTYFINHPMKHGTFDGLRGYGEQYTYYDGVNETRERIRQNQNPSILKRLFGCFSNSRR